MTTTNEFHHALVRELTGVLTEEAAARLHEHADRLERGDVDPYAGKSPAELLELARGGDQDALERYVEVLEGSRPAEDPYQGKSPAELLELARRGDQAALERYAEGSAVNATPVDAPAPAPEAASA